jgi:hypothetical protein
MTRTRGLLIFGIALALVAIPAIAIAATSLWDDVADDNVFVVDTNWMKTTGVSKGCNPPANTEYCPKANLTREQMAAFMRRLATLRVVDAGELEGKTAAELSSVVASAVVDDVTFDPDSANPILLASLTGFDVPASGGAITALANVTAEPVPLGVSQLALVWIEVNGNGTCPNPVTDPAGTGFLYIPAPLIIDTTSAMTTRTVAAGTTRVDLCAAALGTETTNLSARLNVTWNPVTSGAGVATSETQTWQDILAPYAGMLDG